MSAWTLCIDFGTAFSKAAAAPRDAWTSFKPEIVRPLMLAAGQAGANPFLLDSAVFVDKDCVVFGREALTRAEAQTGKKRAALRSFKTLLSAPDLDHALNTNALASLDPHRLFQMRDLVVLYLAYLLAAVDRGVRADSALAGAQVDLRYAAPAWRGVKMAATHEAVTALFAQANALRGAAHDALLAPGGVALTALKTALPAARATPQPLAMDLIFEAPAAAAYSSIALEGAGAHFIVADMGAGTTDIAAVRREGADLHELSDARVTLKQAGDFIDRLIANALMRDARAVKSVADQTALWVALMAQMRDLKETLFAEGRVATRYNGRMLSASLRDIESQRDFKDFYKTLAEAYQHALALAGADAVRRGDGKVNAVAVGGGAAAPFIQKLLRTRPTGSKARVAALPVTPDWAQAGVFEGNLAPVFPQLAIAIGGALAPAPMLAARRLSSASGASGRQSAHD